MGPNPSRISNIQDNDWQIFLMTLVKVLSSGKSVFNSSAASSSSSPNASSVASDASGHDLGVLHARAMVYMTSPSHTYISDKVIDSETGSVKLVGRHGFTPCNSTKPKPER